MLRKLLMLSTPLALAIVIVAACSDDNGSDGDPTAQLTPLVTDAATSGPVETSDPIETAEPPEDESGDDDSAAAGDLFGAINPFSALGSINGAVPSSTSVDPALGAALLRPADLPAGFLNMGEFGFSVPDADQGKVDMAARMFMSGDVTATGELGVMVMSMAATVPPGADMGDLDELDDLTQAELDQIKTSAGQFGAVFTDIRALDAGGLGESGGGLHMEMDFASLFAGFGAPADNQAPARIAMDMYMFVRGDRMLMLMLMYPGTPPAGVDGHALAEIMDGRAS